MDKADHLIEGKRLVIQVYGEAMRRFRPDWVELDFVLESFHPDYEVSLQEVERKRGQLEQEVVALGFSLSDLKTTDFRIFPIYQSDDKGRRLTGFQAHHALRLRFPLNPEHLTNTLARLVASQAQPALHLAFTLKDPESLKQMLIGQAIDNARQKAERIAETLGLRLGRVVFVEEVSNPSPSYRTFAQVERHTPIVPEGIPLQIELKIQWEAL
ncbi:MAG TPA: SIMPL domain-containing protein [Haloplasmataceae bacterium]